MSDTHKQTPFLQDLLLFKTITQKRQCTFIVHHGLANALPTLKNCSRILGSPLLGLPQTGFACPNSLLKVKESPYNTQTHYSFDKTIYKKQMPKACPKASSKTPQETSPKTPLYTRAYPYAEQLTPI